MASNSYIDSSNPLFTSSFTLGLAKDNFIKEDQKIIVDKLINLIDEDDDVQNVYHDMG